MKLQDLNNLLNKLAQKPGRDAVLEFAFAITEWMGLRPNVDKKPQLLSPQTQKLKEYLAPVPQTVQPQLYRLTADGQSIRVRFATLKKLKKDYISQLVDNDPGLTSYQASVKGIINIPGRPAYIPSEPYFIHFVTTPIFDRLTLIFNQGDQKRIITFKNKLTHTQYNKIIEQWHDIANKSKPEMAELLWKSLDIKEVNKEFYKQIKARFDDLVGILKKQNVTTNDNYVKQFAVRLIGRYIFCWFLKEKEIINSTLLSCKTIKNTKDYYRTTLLKLFFDTLNTKIKDRNPLIHNGDFERIPYLNGGLFDESEEDRLFRSVELDEWLIPFVTVLENYDFTVDESNNSYQQVAVDPEMLGRIFENLLASQNPETEKAANNERKAFGAFYTPRDIVDYMVDEGLKTYLSKKLNVDSNELNTAFSYNPVWPEKLSKRKNEAEKALQEVKILDPACGSGAFPMGVLHKLITLRELVSLQPNTYQLKKEILSNNIYGVDIMPMAVEIARLRAWLSLIVEEDYKGEKINSNFGIDALPNLDFKFMQGNSLLETYEGIKLFDDKLLDIKTINQKQDTIERTQKKVSELSKKYLTLYNSDKLTITEKAAIEKEIKENKSLLNKINKVEEPAGGYGLFNEDESSGTIAEKLKKLHKELFISSDKEIKKALKVEIENLEWSLINTSLQEQGKTDKIENIETLRKQKIKPYFLYKLNFPEVFTEKGGFDLVIGNPPYVRQEAIDPYYKPLYILNHPEVGSGTADLYVYFFDTALSVTNTGGIILFITLNKYLKTKYGEGLRRKLKEKNVDLIIDFFELPVFEASTDSAITKIINTNSSDNTRYFPVKSLENLNLNTLTKEGSLTVIKDDTEWKFVNPNDGSILEKLYSSSISLQKFTGDKIYRGLTTGLNDAFILKPDRAEPIINSESNVLVRKYAIPTGIKKWKIEGEKYFLATGFDLNIETEYPTLYKHFLPLKDKLSIRQDKGRNWWNLRACAYYDLFDKPKIIYIRTAKKHAFYFDEECHFINDSCFLISSDNKYLFFFLNSTLFDWFKRIKFVAYGDADEGGRVKLDYNKMVTVPIKELSAIELLWFEQKYIDIKNCISNKNKVEMLENEVEIAILKIYGLTYEEAKIIIPELSEEDYRKYGIQ